MGFFASFVGEGAQGESLPWEDCRPTEGGVQRGEAISWYCVLVQMPITLVLMMI